MVLTRPLTRRRAVVEAMVLYSSEPINVVGRDVSWDVCVGVSAERNFRMHVQLSKALVSTKLTFLIFMFSGLFETRLNNVVAELTGCVLGRGIVFTRHPYGNGPLKITMKEPDSLEAKPPQKGGGCPKQA